MKRSPNRNWYWRFLLVLGVALAIDFLFDDKLILVGVALVWIATCWFSLRRLAGNSVKFDAGSDSP